ICGRMGSRREMVAAEFEGTNRPPRDGRHRRIYAHRLLEGHLGEMQIAQPLIRKRRRSPVLPAEIQPNASSRSRSCQCESFARNQTSEVTDDVSVSCAAIMRKLMWSTMSWVERSDPSS